MRSLKYYVGAGIICLAMLRFAMVHLSSAQDAITTLTPAGTFTVPGDPQANLRSVTSASSSLWFLVSGSGYSTVYRTDGTGAVEATADVTSMTRPDDLCVSDDGHIGVKYRGSTIKTYTQSGQLLTTVTASQLRGASCLFVDNKLMSLLPANGVTSLADGAIGPLLVNAPQPLRTPTLSLSLSNQRAAVIDRATAQLHILDLGAHSWQEHPLVAPDIQGVTRPQPTPTFGVLAVLSAAYDSSADTIYMAAAPYNVRTGASILLFSTDGTLKGHFLCTLPQLPALTTATNPTGQFLFQYIAVVNRELVLISRSQRYCVYYMLA